MDLEVAASSALSSLFYMLLLILAAILISIVLLIRKLNYNLGQVAKSAAVSLAAAVCIHAVFLAISLFLPYPNCFPKPGSPCPSATEQLIPLVPYSFTAVFLLVLLFYLAIKAAKLKGIKN